MSSHLKAKIVSVHKLADTQKNAMFELMEKYYENMNFDSFLADLQEKNDVILLLVGDQIVGFSTLLCKKMRVHERKIFAVYSGDTILERQYWGSTVLGKKFLSYLWSKKILYPSTEVYWFLISKGYKTYLQMANNFSVHYPRYEKATPKFEQDLMEEFYKTRFGDKFNAASGIIECSGPSCRLKSNISPITNRLRRQVPRIAFFEESNPAWEQGQELACIAKMSALLPFQYALKKIFQPQKNMKISSKSVS